MTMIDLMGSDSCLEGGCSLSFYVLQASVSLSGETDRQTIYYSRDLK